MSCTLCFFTISIAAVTQAAIDGVAIRRLQNVVTKLRFTNIKCNSFNIFLRLLISTRLENTTARISIYVTASFYLTEQSNIADTQTSR